MARIRVPSPQTRAVLAELLRTADDWHYGFSLSKQTGQPSGTLYPILARLSDAGMLDTRWEPSPHPGRPPRHLYRLTDTGRRYAHDATVLRAPRTHPELGWQP